MPAHPIFDDHPDIARCLSCGEWDSTEKMVKLEGDHYHEDSPKCRSGVLRCGWCGQGIEQGEAEQDGKDYYHADCLFLMRMADKPAVQTLIQAEVK